MSCSILQVSANIDRNQALEVATLLTSSMQNLHPPTYEDFLTLAGEGTVVPVVKRVIADLLTPVAAYL